MAVIDSVHGDGDLPQLAVDLGNSRTEAASYESDTRMGAPLRMRVSRGVQHSHWDDDDFLPIGEGFERMSRRRRWIG